MESRPHSMTIMISPREIIPDSKVNQRFIKIFINILQVLLIYERVPLKKKAVFEVKSLDSGDLRFAQHFNDPVVRYCPMMRSDINI